MLSRRLASAAKQLRASHSYPIVLMLILVAFGFAALAPDVPWSRGALLLIECLTLVTAIWTSRSDSLARVAPVVLVCVGIAAVQIAIGGKVLTAIAGALSCLLVIAIGTVIVRGIVSEGTVSQRSVIGAICVYFLLGMLFFFIYGTIAILESHAFFAQGSDGTPALRLYFSFVTLATLGYGDYTAATKVGRMFSVLEGLFGQLYLVTVVALLVSRMRFQPRAADRK
jgi:hypothetical protein